MKTLTAITIAMMLFAVPAFGKTLIGEWQLVKIFCEGGQVLLDSLAKTNNKLIFDKVSATRITDMSHMDEDIKTHGCALHEKTNYSIYGNQYMFGPFLEVTSPKCPKIGIFWWEQMKYSPSYIRENISENGANLVAVWQKIKKGNAPPVSFKISDDNQQLLASLSADTVKLCPGARFVKQYKRIK